MNIITKNKRRTTFFLALVIFYYFLLNKLNINVDYKNTIYIIVLLFSYYLVGIAKFTDFSYILKDFILSLFINSAGGIYLYLIYRDKKIFIYSIIFLLFQNILKVTILKIFLEHINIMIIDSGKYTKIIEKILLENKKYNYIGYVNDFEDKDDSCIGKISDIEAIAKDKKINKVIFTSREQIKKYAEIMVRLKIKGIIVIDYLSFLEREEGKVDVDKIDYFWLLMSEGFTSFNSHLQSRLKRVFDLVTSSILLVVSFPFILFTYVLVKTDGGPAFFKQKRIGIGGNEFEIIKFRSMKIHDPKKFSKYASETDDRITKIGHFIRKTRLDELPQLINVFRGEMSFVGPRPEWNELGREYEKHIKNYNLRYAVKPGITGWAQVKYFYSSNLEEVKTKLEYDLFYIKHQDLILDIVILFKTVKIVLFGKGI